MLKTAAQRLARLFGFEIHRVPFPSATTAQTEECGFFGHTLYLPWRETSDFARRFSEAAEHTTLTSDRLWTLYSLARQQIPLGGDVAECGVYRGGSALLLAEVLADAASTGCLWLFDSFAGLPEGSGPEDAAWYAGQFGDTSAEAVAALLRPYIDSVRVTPGLIPDSFEQVDTEASFTLVHLDLDLYQPTLDAFRFFWPRLRPGGVIVVDDYGFPDGAGVRKAMDEVGDRDDMLWIYLPTSQFVAIRR